MNNARKPSEADRERELAELDLLPNREGQKRADDLLRTLLNSPPDPQTPKPKPKKRAK
jgi:hypothetical protein